jgi:hypothetical protein
MPSAGRFILRCIISQRIKKVNHQLSTVVANTILRYSENPPIAGSFLKLPAIGFASADTSALLSLLLWGTSVVGFADKTFTV